MEIVAITTPHLPVSANYPPFGSMAIVKYPRKHGAAKQPLRDDG